jgi:hypothetical protein
MSVTVPSLSIFETFKFMHVAKSIFVNLKWTPSPGQPDGLLKR